MELPANKPSRQARIRMALRGVSTVDAMKGSYRATTSPTEKETWLREVWNHPQTHAWCDRTDPPTIICNSGNGVYNFARSRSGDLVYYLGRRPATDTDLAEAFGYSARCMGWPDGSRTASGAVHDPGMLMLTVIAMWVHSPVRAKELHDMYGAMGLNVASPAGGWDPNSWTFV